MRKSGVSCRVPLADRRKVFQIFRQALRFVQNKTNAASHGEKSCGGHCVKHFWLCERCSDVFTLAYRKPEGVILKFLHAELPDGEAAAAAQSMAAGR